MLDSSKILTYMKNQTKKNREINHISFIIV